jgi:hypothetical protein
VVDQQKFQTKQKKMFRCFESKTSVFSQKNLKLSRSQTEQENQIYWKLSQRPRIRTITVDFILYLFTHIQQQNAYNLKKQINVFVLVFHAKQQQKKVSLFT